MWKALRSCQQFYQDESAPTMVEYGLMLAFVVLIAMIGVTLFGGGVSTLFLVPPDYFDG